MAGRKAYEVPLSAKPQAFTIALGGTAYALVLRWNVAGQYWVLDVMTAARAPLVLGIPVVTGLDLLGQFRHLGFAGALVAQTDGDPDAVPTFANLGTQGRLFFVVMDLSDV